MPVPNDGIVYLRATMTKSTDKTKFYYSTDNQNYKAFGNETKMSFNLTVFVGARFGLFCYSSAVPDVLDDPETPATGYADFDWFTTEDTFEESVFYPEEFEGYPEDMLTAESIALTAASPASVMAWPRCASSIPTR